MLLATLVIFSLNDYAGDLEPSAPPGSTMKTLDEVEPRIPIPGSATPAPAFSIKIKQSGSYYLTGNRLCSSTGIQVDADNVTIDLMGYSLIGPDSGLNHGISMTARTNVEVRNGTVRDFYNGVFENSINGKSHRLVNLRAVSNISHGFYILGSSNLVKDCSASENGDTGIQTRHGCTVTGNTSWENGSKGISAGYGCTVTGNTAYDNNDDGIYASNGSTVTGNTCRSNTGDGIEVTLRSRVTDNTCENNGAGIHLVYGYNHIKANTLIGSEKGLVIDGAGNYVADNIVKGNTDNYDIAEGNQLNILLCEVPETIDWPAMVTLAGTLNVTTTDHNAINVNANDVTIDLGGHSLIGPDSGTGDGIYMKGYSNVEIRNGTVCDFNTGICEASTGLGHDHRVIDVRSIGNSRRGISLYGNGHLVKDCTAFSNGTSAADDVYGIQVGVGSTVTGNTVKHNGSTAAGFVYGIDAGSGSTVTGNTVGSNGSSAGSVRGIDVGVGSTVTGNTANFNGFMAKGTVYGIYLGGYNLVDQNTAYNNDGINMNNPGNCSFGTNIPQLP